jgi:hypothetical protein
MPATGLAMRKYPDATEPTKAGRHIELPRRDLRGSYFKDNYLSQDIDTQYDYHRLC